jgi:hypothetical protein
MLDEHAEFLEGAAIEQQFDPFPRGQLAARMLGSNPLLAAAGIGLSAPGVELFDDGSQERGPKEGARRRPEGPDETETSINDSFSGAAIVYV